MVADLAPQPGAFDAVCERLLAAGDAMATRGWVYLLGGEPGAGTDLGNFIAWAGSGQYSLHLAVWDAETMDLVWQATTASSSTGSESEDLEALSAFVVSTLKEKGIL